MTNAVAEKPAVSRPGTSLFVSGLFPRRRTLVVAVGCVLGFLLAYAWSPQLADDQIGFNTADAMLGHDALATPIAGVASGVLFAFVSGLAGSFTACNVMVLGAVGPLVGESALSRRESLVRIARPIGWLAVGMLPLSALYGALVGIFGTHMPQFSTAHSPGLSPRILQAMIDFGVIGLVMIVLGLAAAGIVPDPLAAVSRRFRNAPLILMGMLIGAFLIGRPYPLFGQMFRSAAQHHNPLYGAAAFALQSLGNIVVMSLIVVVISLVLRGRSGRWLAAEPARVSALTASGFLIAGVFAVVYWDVRLLHLLGYMWFPTAPWH
ncbi:hypothetical protein ACGFW5_20260 [Streptomyces sp. NPDC048416]|uniref:hypothetical protein n=1 Tax=Streptomyces sp. NPDC048416 TaxID=3365546 RepID=UPI003721C22B